MSLITFVNLNGEHDFGGENSAHWREAHAYLAMLTRKYRIAAIARQELTHSRANGKRLLFAAGHALGMTGYIAASSTRESPNAPGIFVNEQLLRVVADYPQETGWWHPACQIKTVRAGTEASPELNLASYHLCSNDAEWRRREALMMVKWGKNEQRPKDPDDRFGERVQTTYPCLWFGDQNSYSGDEADRATLPDWDVVTDLPFRANRTTADGRHDTGPWDVMTRAGFTDLALHAHKHLGQELQGTASLIRTDQGNPDGIRRPRIDFGWGNGYIPETLEGVEIITKPIGSWTDHGMGLFHFRMNDFWDAVAATASPR
ncbi:hypothetical protein [Kitasatospora viridis]|uniref:Endonuclease/exonuclease/phosphatase family protein n=1 Tax=Kitasatospora viridis TaxID=281105 RepID=A0A561SA52_9ACTN|nr:hypothetical protein [Kitasatospora viridis]TWF71756.1 hypothetical protein FHX73_18127 [Kitasatospora viridis]